MSIYSLIYAMQYGLDTEANYPFNSKNGEVRKCKYDPSEVEFTINNAYKIRLNSPDVI